MVWGPVSTAIKTFTALMVFGLAACATSGGSAPPPGGWPRLLQGYRWQLESATDARQQRLAALFARPDRPLVLSFLPGGNLGLRGGCNQVGGSYRVGSDGTLTVPQMISTRMACEPALMQLDNTIGTLLAQPVQLTAEQPGSTSPRLRMAWADKTSLVFVGQPTPETQYGSAAAELFIEVAPRRAACARPQMPNARCLQVRERQYNAQGMATGEPGAWQPLYGDIIGYTHAEGVRNVLRVKRFQRAAPVPADASAEVLVLERVIESEAPP